MKHRYIVGLNIGNHDAAATLIKNGEIVSYIEQERISRNKMAIGEAPIDALLTCLKQESITLRDVEAIAIGMDWKFRNETYSMPEKELNKYLNFENVDWFLPKEIFGDYRPPIYTIKHHLAHAASAYRTSGFDKCAILVVDNRGEDASSSLGFAESGKIDFFKKINIHNSLGLFYNRACAYTGLYGKHREVGKFMGLASYGNPNIDIPLKSSRDGQLFKTLPSIESATIFEAIQLRSQQLSNLFKAQCFPFEEGNHSEIMAYANFAASVQNALEIVLIDFVKELKETTGFDNLVIAGGVALNCTANGKIEQSNIFKHLYVPPFASDAGTAIGAALELYHSLHHHSKTKQPLVHAGLGYAYSNDDVRATLAQYPQLTYGELTFDELSITVAKMIAEGKIVGWMQGGFEAGPRALGNRSILADPRLRKNLIKLNIIKEREMWRPIAPSVLIDYYKEYFTGDPASKYFMNVAAKVHPTIQHQVPAIVHVDETARPQVVLKEQQKFYQLIHDFYQITKIPLVCNTSFNQKGSPLVDSPQDAIECFLQTDIDILVIENFLIKKGVL